jgi:hypothetical protein
MDGVFAGDASMRMCHVDITGYLGTSVVVVCVIWLASEGVGQCVGISCRHIHVMSLVSTIAVDSRIRILRCLAYNRRRENGEAKSKASTDREQGVS